MKAIEQRGYGDPREVLHLTDRQVPEISADQVLVRVRASSVNAADWHLVYGEPVLFRPFGIGGVRAPRRVAGSDFAGVVERVGAAVQTAVPGDEVYGNAPGAFAEFVAAPATRIARKPGALSFAEAAAVPLAGITALQGLRLGGLTTGQRALIVGASGGVGTFAVQLAKHRGAHVTGVCSTRRLDLVRSLGADDVIDYTTDDPASGSAKYDLVFQLGGTASPRVLSRVLTPGGTLVMSTGDGGRWVGPLGQLGLGAILGLVSRTAIKVLQVEETADALDELRDLIDAGQVKPVVDSTSPVERAGEAVARIKGGRPAGKLVLTVGSPS